MSAEPENLLTEWARLVAGTLAAAGVRHVVVSPGSRSTPYLLALAARDDLRLESVLDERSAAFVALGIGRATGAPAALLTTSGTAPAHAHPAVIEASYAEVPLLVLSADRPVELRDSGAAQTIDQTRLFGDHARYFLELGNPSAHPEALRHARRALLAAVAASRGPRPGAVQINLPARKPLEPCEPSSEAGRALRARVDALLASPPTEAVHGRGAPDVERLAARVSRAERPLVVLGPLPVSAASDGTADAVFDLARALGAPVYAEATSQLRFGRGGDGVARVDALDLLLRVPSPLSRFDLAIEIGGPPTSMAYERLLGARPELARIRFEAHRARDPQGTADVAVGPIGPAIRSLLGAITEPSRVDDAWVAEVLEAERAAWAVVDESVARYGESQIARRVIEAMPRGATLTLGNSLPIRTLDRAVPSKDLDLLVLHQRGANGIEGLVSTAAGASIATGRPGALLLGDLSFQHDVGGLAAAAQVSAPLAIVVVNNDGGRIFEQLPLGRDPRFEWIMPRVTTPQRFAIEHAARAFGLEHARVEDGEALSRALGEALSRGGASVIEAVVPASGFRAEEASLLEALAARIGGARP